MNGSWVSLSLSVCVCIPAGGGDEFLKPLTEGTWGALLTSRFGEPFLEGDFSCSCRDYKDLCDWRALHCRADKPET